MLGKTRRSSSAGLMVIESYNPSPCQRRRCGSRVFWWFSQERGKSIVKGLESRGRSLEERSQLRVSLVEAIKKMGPEAYNHRTGRFLRRNVS